MGRNFPCGLQLRRRHCQRRISRWWPRSHLGHWGSLWSQKVGWSLGLLGHLETMGHSKRRSSCCSSQRNNHCVSLARQRGLGWPHKGLCGKSKGHFDHDCLRKNRFVANQSLPSRMGVLLNHQQPSRVTWWSKSNRLLRYQMCIRRFWCTSRSCDSQQLGQNWQNVQSQLGLFNLHYWRCLKVNARSCSSTRCPHHQLLMDLH